MLVPAGREFKVLSGREFKIPAGTEFKIPAGMEFQVPADRGAKEVARLRCLCDNRALCRRPTVCTFL